MSNSLFPRGDFPLLQTNAYVNSAGLGLVPLPVQQATQAFTARLGTEGTLAFFDTQDAIMDGPRKAAMRLFNCGMSSVAVINSVSEAISQIAAWRRPRRGENVVLLDIDHPSTSFPWLRMAEDTGAEIRFAQLAGAPGDLSLQRIAELIDRDTAVVSISHVQWTTGCKLDIKALADIARANGALLVVDATHSVGVVPLDAPALGVDVLATGSFKWLLAYSGTGICYVREGLADELRPVMVGSRTSHMEAVPEGRPISALSLPPGARRLEYGSSAHILRIAYAGSMEYLLRHGIEQIRDHVQGLGTTLANGLLDLGATVHTPLAPADRAGIITASFPGRDSAALVAALAERNVTAILRMGMIRFSPHGFNDAADIERVVGTLRELTA